MRGILVVALAVPAAAVLAALGLGRLLEWTQRMRRRAYLRLAVAAAAFEIALAAAAALLGGGARRIAPPAILGVCWLVVALAQRRAWRGALDRPVGEDGLTGGDGGP